MDNHKILKLNLGLFTAIFNCKYVLNGQNDKAKHSKYKLFPNWFIVIVQAVVISQKLEKNAKIKEFCVYSETALHTINAVITMPQIFKIDFTHIVTHSAKLLS